MKTILIVGLGNPGKEYEKTRHNAGFMFVDYFREKFRDEFSFSDWKIKKKMNAEISVGKFDEKKIILAKPQTFMNLSGEAVRAVLKYYKVKLSNLIVVHDEIDLLLGKYKFSTNSSSAGHQGAQNVIDALGTKDFMRVRIGIDNRVGKKIPTEKYVLGKFTSNELRATKDVLKKSADELLKYIS